MAWFWRRPRPNPPARELVESDTRWRALDDAFTEALRRRDTFAMITSSGELVRHLLTEGHYHHAMLVVSRPVVMIWVDLRREIAPVWLDAVELVLLGGVSPGEARRLFVEGARALHVIPRYRVDARLVWLELVKSLGAQDGPAQR